MADDNQLSFGDGLLSGRRKISKLSKHPGKLDQIIDWKPLVQQISVIDKTDRKTGGRPRTNPLWMIKATFLQSLFSLSDPQLEDQLIDRLSFQRFVGINLDQQIPDFSTFWRFKEVLATHNLDERIFELINEQLETKGLMVKKGTIVDATICPPPHVPCRRNAVRSWPKTPPGKSIPMPIPPKKAGGIILAIKAMWGWILAAS